MGRFYSAPATISNDLLSERQDPESVTSSFMTWRLTGSTWEILDVMTVMLEKFKR